MTGLLDEANHGFEAVFGYSPDGVWSAPGRVNLIGEHTDYNEGFVLPIAIDRRTFAALARRDDGLVRVSSSSKHGTGEHAARRLARHRPRLGGLPPGRRLGAGAAGC